MDTPVNELVVRPYAFGDPSSVCALHARLYKQRYGFSGTFEYYVMKYMADFLADPAGGGLWVAELGGRVVGSIAIVKAPQEGPRSAQLRWFIVDDGCQGLGIGKLLMRAAMDFCRASGYDHVFLWTLDFLDAALHIYKKYGFELTDESPNSEWTATAITEQRYDLRGLAQTQSGA